MEREETQPKAPLLGSIWHERLFQIIVILDPSHVRVPKNDSFASLSPESR